MNARRLAVAILWTYTGLAAGMFAEYVGGIPAILGLVLGIAAAVFFAGDPLHIVWPKKGELPSGAAPSAADREPAAA